MMGALESRAASREATTVEEEVTFCNTSETISLACRRGASTHDGGNGKLVLFCILEKSQHICPDNNTTLPAENVEDTHDCS